MKMQYVPCITYSFVDGSCSITLISVLTLYDDTQFCSHVARIKICNINNTDSFMILILYHQTHLLVCIYITHRICYIIMKSIA